MTRKAKPPRRHRVPGASTPLRAKLHHLSDEQLLATLSGFGIALDRSSLEQLCEHSLGAVPLTNRLLESAGLAGICSQARIQQIQNCVAHLWQRWFPQQSSFDKFEERIMAGNDLLDADDAAGACRAWLEAWAEMLALLERGKIASIDEFERQYNGMSFVRQWFHDLDCQLWNAGLDDPQFLRSAIAVCEERLKRFAADEAVTEFSRMALAESHFELNNAAQTDALYRQWLGKDPQWGWGWISWAHCYQGARPEMQDLKRGEQILLEGRAVDQVRNPDDITTNLAYIHEQQGRLQEARLLAASVRSTTFPPPSELKVGRNEPCPCGSGKKFKKCCGSVTSST
jgi:hypothetical protein